VLHSFRGTDWASAVARVVLDAAGSMYGTTEDGGASGFGTVFNLDKTGKETVLQSFRGTDGHFWSHVCSWTRRATLYGTVPLGGRPTAPWEMPIDLSHVLPLSPLTLVQTSS
jgi:uncharacterized repeat protein (TIGR03803 family)